MNMHTQPVKGRDHCMLPCSHCRFVTCSDSVGIRYLMVGISFVCMHEINYNVSMMCELFLIFSLSGNSISDVGAVALGEMLKENESLKELK